MTEKRYANREIDTFVKTIKDHLDENAKEAESRDTIIRAELQSGFNAVTARQDTANGRVSKLEKWMYTSLGGLSVLTLVVVPILGWALFILVNIDGMVHRSVDNALSAYDITN